MTSLYLFYYTLLSTVVLASTTCSGLTATPTTIANSMTPDLQWPNITETQTLTTPRFTSPLGWNATRTTQSSALSTGLRLHLPWIRNTTTTGYISGTTTALPHPKATVIVGEAGKLIFSPSSLNVSVGSTIAFSFLGLNHTLTESSLGNPCQYADGFDSGFKQFNPANVSDKFIIEYKVTDANPKWFFCAQSAKGSHCRAGMVFSLNAHGAHSLFLHNALTPTETPTGGVCRLPASVTSTFVPSTTLSTRVGASPSTVPPQIVTSGGAKKVVGLGLVLAFALL